MRFYSFTILLIAYIGILIGVCVLLACEAFVVSCCLEELFWGLPTEESPL
jgi:hypothetical protein